MCWSCWCWGLPRNTIKQKEAIYALNIGLYLLTNIKKEHKFQYFVISKEFKASKLRKIKKEEERVELDYKGGLHVLCS